MSKLKEQYLRTRNKFIFKNVDTTLGIVHLICCFVAEVNTNLWLKITQNHSVN